MASPWEKTHKLSHISPIITIVFRNNDLTLLFINSTNIREKFIIILIIAQMLYKPTKSFFIYSILLIIILLSTNNAIYSQKTKQVEILNSDQLIISKKFGSNIKRLSGL